MEIAYTMQKSHEDELHAVCDTDRTQKTANELAGRRVNQVHEVPGKADAAMAKL